MKELLKNNIDLIFNYSFFITGNRDKALDLMQDTIVSILGKSGVYKDYDAFKPWIFKVLRNNYLNKCKYDQVLHEINESELAPDNVVTLDFEDHKATPELTSDPILQDRLLEALASMPIEYRETCYLVDIEQVNYDEAAAHLNVPVGTIMSRLHRGREYLKKKLRREAHELKIITSERKKKYAHE